MVYQYITTPPVSKYFSDLVSSLSNQFFHLDALVHATEYVSFNLFKKDSGSDMHIKAELLSIDAGCVQIKREKNYSWKLIRLSMICITSTTCLELASLV